MLKGYIKVGAGLIFAVIFLLLFVTFAGIDEIISILQKANPFYILLALVFSLLMSTVRGRIWQENLGKVGNNLSLTKCVEAVYSSLFVSSFFAAGQPITAYLLSKDSKSGAEKNFAAMVGQDVMHWVSSYVLIGTGIVFYVFFNPQSMLNHFLLSFLILAGLGIVFSIYVLWKKETWLDHTAIFTGDLVYRIRKLFKGESLSWKKNIEKKMEWEMIEFEKGLHLIFDSKRYTIKLFVFSVLDRFFLAMVSYNLLLSIGVSVPLFLVFMINSMSSIFRLMPLPGGIGPIEIGMTSILVFLFELSLPIAASAVLLYRIVQYWIPLMIGGVSLWLLSDGVFLKHHVAKVRPIP